MKSKQGLWSGAIIELLAEPQWTRIFVASAMTEGLESNGTILH